MDEVLNLRGTRYELVERLSSGDRQRFRAFDRHAGPRGDYRTIHVLPRSKAAEQQLGVLRRLADSRNGNVPFFISHHVQGDRIYIVSSWTPGQPLDDYLHDVRSGKTSRPSAFNGCRLVRGQAHGLCQLHSAWDVHHGDIKPANLILSPQGRALSTIDFGSGWLGQRTMERNSGDGASGVYSAPEILEAGTAPDFRSDQFSLSVVWYEMLTLAIPYEGAGGRAGLAATRSAFAGKLVPPSKLEKANQSGTPRGLWRQIDAAVCRGLAIDPEGRFPSPRDWLNALDDIHYEFRRRTRLRGFNRVMTSWLERIVGHFARPR